MTLTAKQSAFVSEYLVDLNATQAAIRAGYSPNTAASIGSQTIAKPEVQAAVTEARSALAARTEVTAARVIAEWACLAFFDPADIAASVRSADDIGRLPEATRRAIVGWGHDRSGRFFLKLSPKTPALEAIARHLGLFAKDAANGSSAGLAELIRASYGQDPGMVAIDA